MDPIANNYLGTAEIDLPGVGTYTWYPAEDRLIWSADLVQIYGLERPPDVENGFIECVHPEDRVAVEAEISLLLSTGTQFAHEFRIIRPDGEIRHIHDRGTIDRDADGKVVRVAGLNVDITEQVGARARLDERPNAGVVSDDLARLIRLAPTAVAIFDRQMRFVAVSDSFATQFRLPPDTELGGRSMYDVLPETPEHWRAMHDRPLNGSSLSIESGPFPRRDGTTDHVRWAMSPWLDGSGAIVGALFMAEVVTGETAPQKVPDDKYGRASLAVSVAGLGIGEVDYAAGTVHLDAEAAELLGLQGGAQTVRRDEVHDRFHPDDRAWLDPMVAQAYDPDGDGMFEAEHRIVHHDGSIRWVRAAKLVSFEDGPVGKRATSALLTVLDMTERARLGEALRESERFAHATLDANPDCLFILDHIGNLVFANQSGRDHFADGKADMVGYAFASLWPDAARNAADMALAKARDEFEARVDLNVEGGERGETWWSVHISSIDQTTGRLGTYVAVCSDITERKQSEVTVRAAHETFRQLVEGSPFGLYTVDENMRISHASEGTKSAMSTLGPLIGQGLGDVMRAIWPEQLATEIVERFRHTLKTGEAYVAPTLVEERNDMGEIEAYDWQIDRINLPNGRPGVVCHFYDLSERQRHEEHIRVLMRETTHRSKNLLSLVQAVARRTAQGDPTEFLDSFMRRIDALAEGQDLLIQTDGRGVNLDKLVRTQLSHFDGLLDDRITIFGPPVLLTPEAAQVIGMALHELATNAAKYGALSRDGGRIAIAWSVDASGHRPPDFGMSWVERDGPPVVPPTRTGFGETVVKTIVENSLSANVTLDYASDGLQWVLACPFVEVSEMAGRPHLGRGRAD